MCLSVCLKHGQQKLTKHGRTTNSRILTRYNIKCQSDSKYVTVLPTTNEISSNSSNFCSFYEAVTLTIPNHCCSATFAISTTAITAPIFTAVSQMNQSQPVLGAPSVFFCTCSRIVKDKSADKRNRLPKRLQQNTEQTETRQPFYGPSSGTIRVSRRQKRTSGIYGARGLIQADTLTIRLGAIPSGLTSAHLHHAPIFFYGPDSLPAAQPTVSKH